jgi:hypothetical protein
MDPVKLSQWIRIQANKISPKKEKNEEISHLRSSLEGQRLLLESERPLDGLYKKFSALSKHFVLTEYFSSVFVLNKPCSGSGPDNDFIKVWIRIQ